MTNQPMWRSRHVHWPRRKIKCSPGRQKAIKQDSEHKLNEMKKQKGTHISNMTRHFGTNLRSVLPKTLYEQDCQQIHDFLFFPLVSTDESICLPSLVLFICISWPGLCISKAPVAPKTIFTPFDKHLFIKRRHRHDLYFFQCYFQNSREFGRSRVVNLVVSNESSIHHT